MNYSSPARGSTASQSTHVASSESSTPRRLGVLGIGLIMEEVGKGARLIFRYPSSPPPSFLDHSHASEGESNGKGPVHNTLRGGMRSPKNNASKNKSHRGSGPSTSNNEDGSNNDTVNSNSASSGSIDLFFDLPARVLSKLFRPKRPLCGQPLTLNVSGTTFCCRAELFDSQPSTIGGGEGSNHPLVLFSVIVALAPLAPSSADEAQQHKPQHHSTQQYPFDFSDGNNSAENSHPHLLSSQRSDSTFHTVRCVHRNLARLCRVLTREELRCRYVSRQCNMLLQIRNDYESNRVGGPDCASLSAGSEGSGNNNSSTAVADNVGSSKKGDGTPPGPPPLSPKEKVKDTMKSSKVISSDETTERPDMSQAQRREYVQNLIEIMLAASPPKDGANSRTDDDSNGNEQHGNLARELAHVFHWMSSPPTAQGFLSRQAAHGEGVVYINRHIAVPLDRVDADLAHNSSRHHQPAEKQHHVRSYHTLLFPNSSPSEVLKGLMVGVNEVATSPSISHSLRRILPHIQPRKSLHEISWEAGLSLPHVIEAATWLVHSGICVAAMPVLRKNHYTSAEGVVPKMSSLALPFWQTFGARSKHCKFHWGGESHSISSSADVDDDTARRKRTVTTGVPHVFVVVSSLTTKTEDNSSASPTLGEAIDSFSGVERNNRDDLSPHYKHSDSFQYGESRHVSRQSSGSLNLGNSGGVPIINPLHLSLSPTAATIESLAEDIVYSMAVWLVANKILVEVKDFLVAVEASSCGSKNGNKAADAHSSAEESLYHELLQSGCLDGTTSIPAICYRFGILDRIRMEKFILWGQQSNRLVVVSRMARPTDDGGSP